MKRWLYSGALLALSLSNKSLFSDVETKTVFGIEVQKKKFVEEVNDLTVLVSGLGAPPYTLTSSNQYRLKYWSWLGVLGAEGKIDGFVWDAKLKLGKPFKKSTEQFKQTLSGVQNTSSSMLIQNNVKGRIIDLGLLAGYRFALSESCSLVPFIQWRSEMWNFKIYQNFEEFGNYPAKGKQKVGWNGPGFGLSLPVRVSDATTWFLKATMGFPQFKRSFTDIENKLRTVMHSDKKRGKSCSIEAGGDYSCDEDCSVGLNYCYTTFRAKPTFSTSADMEGGVTLHSPDGKQGKVKQIDHSIAFRLDYHF